MEYFEDNMNGFEIEEENEVTISDSFVEIDYNDFLQQCNTVTTDLEFATEYQKLVFCWYSVNPSQKQDIKVLNFTGSVLNSDLRFLAKYGIFIEGKGFNHNTSRDYVMNLDKKYVKDLTLLNYMSAYIKDNLPTGKVPTTITLFPSYKSLDLHQEDLNKVKIQLYNYVNDVLGEELLSNFTLHSIEGIYGIGIDTLDKQQGLFQEKLYWRRVGSLQDMYATYGKTNIIDITSLVLKIKDDILVSTVKIAFNNIIDKILKIVDENTLIFFDSTKGSPVDNMHYNNLCVYLTYKYNISCLSVQGHSNIEVLKNICFNQYRVALADQIAYILNFPTLMVRPNTETAQTFITTVRKVNCKLSMVKLNEVATGDILFGDLDLPGDSYEILNTFSEELFNIYKDDVEDFLNVHKQLQNVLHIFRKRLGDNRVLSLFNTCFLKDASGDIYIATVEDFKFEIKGIGYNYGLNLSPMTVIDDLSELGNWIPIDMVTDKNKLYADLARYIILPLVVPEQVHLLDSLADDELPSMDELLVELGLEDIPFTKSLTLSDFLINRYGDRYCQNLDHRDFVSICLNYIDCIAFRKRELVDQLRELNLVEQLNIFGCFDPVLKTTQEKIVLDTESFVSL